jgi:hypothetical protein
MVKNSKRLDQNHPLKKKECIVPRTFECEGFTMRILALVTACTLATSSPAIASTVNLDFSGNICNGSGTCIDGSRIDQSYGDIAGQVDVVYDANRSTAVSDDMFYWSTGYEDLNDVAYGFFGGGGASIALESQTGYEITLNGFDIAPYANRDRNTQIEIFDLFDNSSIFSQTYTPLTTAGATSLSFGNTSSSGFLINFGPDAWDIGIDNISFDVKAVSTTTPIPLPAALPLLLAALGGMAMLRRRTTAA